MKIPNLIALLVCVAALRAQTATAPHPAPAAISRESLLELQLLLNREREVKDKLQPIYDLLMEPVKQARAAVVERICKAAGIPMQENGKPACEVDMGAGVARRVSSEKKEK